ncbi:MAG: ABC transporter permease [Spirochaetaceae bacterium]
MNYLPALIKQDIKFQFRHGFYLVYGIITVIYAVLLKLLSINVASIISPIIIFSDPTFIGFLFIGAILFFEREQRITEVLFITPITKSAYILSKCISLTTISLLVVIIITLVIHGPFINWFYLLLGVTLTSFIFILLGMLISNYLKKVTTYMVVGGLCLSPASMPILYYLGLSDSKLFYLIPTTASIKLIDASINGGISGMDFLYSFLYLTVLTAILFKLLIKIKGADGEDI